MKSPRLFFYYRIPPSFSSFIKHFPSLALRGLARGLPSLQTPNCNSPLLLSKPIFAREVSGHLFVLVQYSNQEVGYGWEMIIK